MAARLDECGENLLFVIDGLDNVGHLDRGAVRNMGAHLNSLSNVGQVLVTCRPEVWDAEYSHLSFLVRHLTELPEELVTEQLGPAP